jgi:general secretion pathway protein K
MVKRMRTSRRGVALLVVLLGLALMTLIVVDFASESGLGFVSAANQSNEVRAYYLARSAIGVGLALLAQSARIQAMSQSQQIADSLQDVWAVPFPPLALDGGQVSLAIVDEARKVNINLLITNDGKVNPQQEQILERLLAILNVNPQVIPAIVDWLDPDSIESPGGAESDYYLGLKPPYQARNGPMPTIGDLRMIKGVDDVVFNRISPYLTVMPETQVNANTAPPEVLAALDPELMEDEKAVKEIIAARSIRPFTAVTDVANLPDISSFGTRLTQVLTVRSQFFTITGMGTFAGARKIVSSTFHREQTGVGTLTVWHED